MDVVERYLSAVAAQDWDTFAQCISADVVRVGPFGDVYEGRDAYMSFLRNLMPTLVNYRMDVERVVYADGKGVAIAELSETMDFDGRTVRTPESLLFDLDRDGRIRHIAIYVQRLT